jgi:prepilin-type N-terminal cleavage/methylation domain-containing protein/prepilin-type processing-associated H-X9-DG protein
MGRTTDAQALIASAEVSESGMPFRRLLELLADNHCPGRAIYTDKNRLTLLPVPSILLVDGGSHCIVYEGLDQNRKARIFETTSRENRTVDLDTFRRAWTGEAIVFEEPQPSRLAFLAMCLCVVGVCGSVIHFVLRYRPSKGAARGAFTLVELVTTIAIVGILLAFVLPAVQHARETSRGAHCRSNLHQIGIALHQYQQTFGSFPPAVRWGPPGEPLGRGIAAPGSIDRISLGLASAEYPDRIFSNWVIALLPFLDQVELYGSLNLNVPIGDSDNEAARATEIALMLCPTDPASAPDNRFQRSGLTQPDTGYARANYAINAGTNRRCLTRLSRRRLSCPDGVSVNGSDLRVDTSQVWGSGVAGLNRSMRLSEFVAGLSNTIAVEEIRAGVNPLDRRGVWALGLPGSSITACHGLYGNNGPNTGKDVIQGCSEAVTQGGDPELQGMPCLRAKTDPRLEISERATARSLHPGGVNVLMADGSARFVTNEIDKRAWHDLHRRDHSDPVEF